MDITVSELAALVGGRVTAGSGETRITGAASIADATTGQVTFFGNARYLPALKSSVASAALVPPNFSEMIGAACIEVENPSFAFAQVLQQFAPPPIDYPVGVHPTAVVGANVTLGEGVSVQPFVVIEEGAHIGRNSFVGAHSYIGHFCSVGDDCRIYPRVTLRERTVIGNRVILHSGAVLGSDGFGFEMVEGRHAKIPQIGIVQVDDDVEIGANTAIDRARFGRTWIQQGTKIDNLVQIAHNVVVGKHSIIVSQAGISGSSRLGDYVTLAGQAGLVGHIEVGDQAIIGAQSGVSKNVPAKEIWLGSPATPMREQKEKFARINRLPKLLERLKKLEQVVQQQTHTHLPSA